MLDLIPSRLPATLACLLLAAWTAFASEPRPRSLYDGARVRFERAIFLKPQEATNAMRVIHLAPLIIQEAAATNAVAGMTNRPTQPDDSALQPGRVFYQAGALELGKSHREQMTYWWFYDSPDAGARALGVRLTMSSNGVPVIYEVLESPGGLGQIFVAQSIEAAAQREFGPPLPGRRHAVERSLSDAPDVVVPRVLENSPDIMGPILYLNAESHSVATLICRCMDAQAGELIAQGLYELVPGDNPGHDSGATRLDAANPRRLPEDFLNSSNRLSRSLRLPVDF